MAGGVLQWLAQIAAQSKAGMGKLRFRFNWRLPGVSDVLKVMVPATLSSGMLYINVSTDLFFASFNFFIISTAPLTIGLFLISWALTKIVKVSKMKRDIIFFIVVILDLKHMIDTQHLS
jgi:hypothetical protein